MSFSRIRPDAEWANGNANAAADMKLLDDKQVNAMNGDGGGTHVLGASVIIGGDGIVLRGPSRISAPGGMACQVITTGGTRVTHDDDDYVELGAGHAGITPIVRTGFAQQALDTSRGLARFYYELSDNTLENYEDTATREGGRLLAPLRVVHGGRLTQVDMRFAVGQTRANVPEFLVQMRVVRIDAYGVVTPLRTSGVQPDGWKFYTPTPASGAAWYNAGAVKTISYPTESDSTCDVDIGLYSYWIEIVDESGTDALNLNRFLDADATHDLVADIRPQ